MPCSLDLPQASRIAAAPILVAQALIPMTIVRRHRRSLASLVLGMWLLAAFIGIANACLPGQGATSQLMAQPAMAMGEHHPDETAPSDCAKFCNDDLPLFAKLKLVQELPAVQPLLVTAFETPVAVDPIARVVPTHLAHPPPDVPLYLRSLRLAL